MVPNFFILGAAKCGTSALNFYLSQHPDFAMARPKEPPFFAAEFERGLDYYRRTYFAHWQGETFVGDAAHRNLYLPYVPARIYKTNPDAKLIVLLRNPVDRAYSHYWHNFSHNVQQLSFEECLELDKQALGNGQRFETQEDYVSALNDLGETPDHPTFLDTGHYSEQIERYQSLFGRDRMFIALFDDLVSDTSAVVARVVEFLGAEPFEIPDLRPQNQAASRALAQMFELVGRIPLMDQIPYTWRAAGKRFLRNLAHKPNPSMKPETRAWLVQYYRPEIQRLQVMTGMDVSAWT